MFLFKNSRNKVTRIGLNLLVYSLVLCVVLLVASSWITSMYRLWDSVYQIGLIGVFVGVFVSVVGLGLPKTPNASSDLKPSSSVRLKEGYDGKFTEFYLDLCQENGTFFIKKISYHYNAGRTDLIKEIVVPENKNTKEKIVKFIAQKSLAFKWCTVSVDELLNNDKLMTFIESGLQNK